MGKTLARHELRRAKRSTLQRVHKCIEIGGGIFENLLWDVPDVDWKDGEKQTKNHMEEDNRLNAELWCPY
jgi:hypothetical protein